MNNSTICKDALSKCRSEWNKKKYISLCSIEQLASEYPNNFIKNDSLGRLLLSFNGSDISIEALNKQSAKGDINAIKVLEKLQRIFPEPTHYKIISSEQYYDLKSLISSDPEIVYKGNKLPYFPYYVPGRCYGYDITWVRKTLENSSNTFIYFKNSVYQDTAILVGNGPSLNKTDISLLEGHDVYISNYAINHPILSRLSKGVAVTNYLVAEQEPYSFYLNQNKWKFFPFWLGNTFFPDERTIFLNAEGGDLFCSNNILKKIAWHSTVSFFWLQILYSAGYKKVILIGMDNSYIQSPNAKEGKIIEQKQNDPNHFDHNYFKGKKWQAADVSKMEETYIVAKEMYEKDNREVVNCTVGGNLEVFRRSTLEKELPAFNSKKYYSYKFQANLKIATITPFWKGDIDQAELHWRIINRLNIPINDHYHIFKQSESELPPNTFLNIICADIDKKFPHISKKPHPSGPNILFAYTVRLMKEKGYSHFFWLEPDCIPISKDWFLPFVESAKNFPDEAIVGTGGGTIVPGKKYWKNHFAGCSLYNVEKLNKLNWDVFINDYIHISFDIWMSINLGYISLNERNDKDLNNTIIYGSHRYNWTLNKKPPSVVIGMFEHWRPNKCLTNDAIMNYIKNNKFSIFHAIKEKEMIEEIFKILPYKVTTIILNYNNEKYLKDAIESAINQYNLDNIDYEVIVVDDGSNDGSIEIIEKYKNRIIPIYLKHGLSNNSYNQHRAFKKALKIANGDIIFLLNGDDIFFQNKVSTIAPIFNDPEVVLAQHALQKINVQHYKMEMPTMSFAKNNICINLYNHSNRVNFFQPTSGLVFRKNYLNYAIKWLRFDHFQNTGLDIRLTVLSPIFGKVVNISEVLGNWRKHANSDSISKEDINDKLLEHHQWFNNEAKNYGIYIDYTNNLLNAKFPIFVRKAVANIDETDIIAQLFKGKKGVNNIMINVGHHIDSFIQHFNELGWKIYFYEPDPVNCKILLQKLGKFNNIQIYSKTIGETSKFDVTTILNIIEDNELEAIDILKISMRDIKFSVLKSIPWGKLSPNAIIYEFRDTKTKHLSYIWKDICEYLKQKNYTIYISEWHPIVPYNIEQHWLGLKCYPCELENPKAWGNILAFKKDPGIDTVYNALIQVLKVEFPKEFKNNLQFYKNKIDQNSKYYNIIYKKIKYIYFRIFSKKNEIK